MKLLTTTVAIAAVLATLSGCVVAPDRGNYRDRDDRYDHRYRDHDRDVNVHTGENRAHDGDHAGGTGTPD